MRFKSSKQRGYQVFAVTGVNTLSFAISTSATADTAGLLGFAVEREDLKANERYFMPGFKVFEAVIPHPDEKTFVTTFDHPVQSFVWDDFTGKPGQSYIYRFYPLKGTPKHLDRSAAPLTITVKTEALFTTGAHDVFFNRGVASSQAYARKFHNKAPDQQPDTATTAAAFKWLARDLEDAIVRFIDKAAASDTLLCCFYEFRHRGVADAIKKAIDRGVTVRLILDMKANESPDDGNPLTKGFPRDDNEAHITAAGIPLANIIRREARPNNIQHNKFMVLLKGASKVPKQVWTGSTNISAGGIYGQTNVGHWIRDGDVAKQYLAYWNLLGTDPGGVKGDTVAVAKTKNAAFKTAVEALGDPPLEVADINAGMTPVFSPRGGLKVLEMYAKLLDSAERSACITLAFGINQVFKQQLVDHDAKSALTFLLLEKRDAPTAKNAATFVALGARHNVYEAWGSYLNDPLSRWARETSTFALGLNKHVMYIHSKFLLKDPLSADPIVVTGSANFSDASTNDNDENMVIIRGNTRVADIYFTEFNRLFNHYYFRSVVEATKAQQQTPAVVVSTNTPTQFLEPTDVWLEKYKQGKLRRKRVDVFAGMEGFA